MENTSNALNYEQAILPYAGRGDIHMDINAYLREGTLKNKTYPDITDTNIKKYSQVLDYGLKKLDEEYGEYSGIVYRCSIFSPTTPNYVSTSDKMQGAVDFADPKNPSKNTFNIIFTNHGHKINQMQKRLGYKFAKKWVWNIIGHGKIVCWTNGFFYTVRQIERKILRRI